MTTTRAWIYAAILGQALTLSPGVAQSTVNRDRPRSSYDPGAAGNAKNQKPGGVESALGRLNPENKDFGAAIDTLRVAAIEETIDNYLWWMSACLLFLLSLAGLYIYWLTDERAARLDISADIVAQLWNAHCGSRRKAIEFIDIYNTLMRRFNAQTVELTAARGAAEATAKDLRDAKKKKSIEPADKIKAGTIVDLPVEKTEQLSLLPDETGAVATAMMVSTTTPDYPDDKIDAAVDSADEPDEEQDEVKRLKGEIARVLQENSQLKAQACAQNQKLSNLRTQLNRAHDQYKGQPQQGVER